MGSVVGVARSDGGRWRVAVARAVACVVVMAGASGVAAAPSLASAPPSGSQSFTFTGSPQSFTVPAGVSRVQVIGWGGSGGAGAFFAVDNEYAAPGGLGAQISLVAVVSPGDKLTVNVGGAGGDSTGQTGGAGGVSSGDGQNGGVGGNINSRVDGDAGGGGGAGTLVTDSTSSTTILDAGGGGGGGGAGTLIGDNGGRGGDDNGGNRNGAAGQGGTPGAGGVYGVAGSPAGAPG